MKKLALFLFALVLSFNLSAQQSKEKKEAQIDKKVEVFYFHGTRRCMTCKAVGNVAKDFLEENYAKEIKSGLVAFHDINYDKAENKALAKEMNITSSSLVVKKTSGSEVSIENITNLAFLNALKSPEKLKEAIKKEVESII